MRVALRFTVAALVLVSGTASGAGLMGFASPLERCANSDIQVHAQAFAGNDLMPLKNLTKNTWDNYQPGARGNKGALAVYGEAAGAWKGMCAGYFFRGELAFSGNRDAVDALGANKQNRPLDVGRRYVPDYWLKGFSADGVKVGYSLKHALGGWELLAGAAVAVMKGREYKNDAVIGDVLATSGRQVSGILDRDYAYSGIKQSQLNPFVPSGTPSGSGWSLDLALRLTRADGVRLELTVMDALANMQWSQMPRMQQTANNATASYDVYGNRNATINGQDSRGDISYRPAAKIIAAVEIPIPFVTLNLSDTYWHGQHFPLIGLSREFVPGWRATIDYDTYFRSIGVSLQGKGMVLGLRSETGNFSSAKTLGVNMGYSHRF